MILNNEGDSISHIFFTRILNETDCLPMLMYNTYKRNLSSFFPDKNIFPSFSCYSELLSYIYEEFEEKEIDDNPMESDRFKILEKYIEASEVLKIKQNSKIERFLTFYNEYKDPNSSFIESNFITSLFPESKEELEE